MLTTNQYLNAGLGAGVLLAVIAFAVLGWGSASAAVTVVIGLGITGVIGGSFWLVVWNRSGLQRDRRWWGFILRWGGAQLAAGMTLLMFLLGSETGMLVGVCATVTCSVLGSVLTWSARRR